MNNYDSLKNLKIKLQSEGLFAMTELLNLEA